MIKQRRAGVGLVSWVVALLDIRCVVALMGRDSGATRRIGDKQPIGVDRRGGGVGERLDRAGVRVGDGRSPPPRMQTSRAILRPALRWTFAAPQDANVRIVVAAGDQLDVRRQPPGLRGAQRPSCPASGRKPRRVGGTESLRGTDGDVKHRHHQPQPRHRPLRCLISDDRPRHPNPHDEHRRENQSSGRG